MAKPKRRKWETKKYQISLQRRGVHRFDDAYDARAAARLATAHAKEGWTSEVQSSSASGNMWTRKLITHMKCQPKVGKRGRTIAVCSMRPAFKRKVRGL